MTLGNRIREFMRYKQLTQEELGKKVGFSGQAIGKYLSGTNKPKFDFWYGLAKNFPDLNINHILTGNGDMFLTDREKTLSFNNEVELMEFILNNPQRFVGMKSYDAVLSDIKESNSMSEIKKQLDLINKRLTKVEAKK